MRAVLIPGLVGAIPGAVLIAVAVAIEVWVESGGGMGVGILGAFALWVGVFIGTLRGASASEHEQIVRRGIIVGFAIGLICGIGVSAAFTVTGAWMFLPPVGLIIGAGLGEWTGEHHVPPGTTMTHG